MADIEGTILNIIANKAKTVHTGLSRTTEMRGLDLDSLDVVEIFFEIDEAFDISLPFNANEAASVESARFRTAGDVSDLVTEQIALQGGRKTA